MLGVAYTGVKLNDLLSPKPACGEGFHRLELRVLKLGGVPRLITKRR